VQVLLEKTTLMKTLFSITLISSLSAGLLFVSCSQPSNGQQNVNEPAQPGPITESDKYRYSLQSNSELEYGTIQQAQKDSLSNKNDSLKTDSQQQIKN